MSGFILGALVFVLFVVMAFGILRALVQTWIDHRVRLVLLENLEREPESPAAVQKMLADVERVSRQRRHDYTLTGILLASLGLSCTGYGRFVGIGRLAVGMYVGGMICVGIGILLALFGMLIQYLASESRTR